jgi:hypothetical protein
MVADSRTVALNHTAGLSTPQQVQMALFALFALMDEDDAYKHAMKRTVRRRHQALYRALGFEVSDDPNAVDYYTILDLEVLGTQRYWHDFVDWLLRNKNPLEILFRLADEGGVVLLPGKGFGTPHPSARVSLANLNEDDYAKIGRIIRSIMDEYGDEHQRAKAASSDAICRHCAGPCRRFQRPLPGSQHSFLPRCSASAPRSFGCRCWVILARLRRALPIPPSARTFRSIYSRCPGTTRWSISSSPCSSSRSACGL